MQRHVPCARSDIQRDTESAVIHQINDISNTIASTDVDQTATTNEMTRNVAEAAKGTSKIAQNITGDVTAAGELSRMSAELQQAVAQFKM